MGSKIFTEQVWHNLLTDELYVAYPHDTGFMVMSSLGWKFNNKPYIEGHRGKWFLVGEL